MHWLLRAMKCTITTSAVRSPPVSAVSPRFLLLPRTLSPGSLQLQLPRPTLYQLALHSCRTPAEHGPSHLSPMSTNVGFIVSAPSQYTSPVNVCSRYQSCSERVIFPSTMVVPHALPYRCEQNTLSFHVFVFSSTAPGEHAEHTTRGSCYFTF